MRSENKFRLVRKKNKDAFGHKYWAIEFRETNIGEVERRRDWVLRKETDTVRSKMAYLYTIRWDNPLLRILYRNEGINITNYYSVTAMWYVRRLIDQTISQIQKRSTGEDIDER